MSPGLSVSLSGVIAWIAMSHVFLSYTQRDPLKIGICRLWAWLGPVEILRSVRLSASVTWLWLTLCLVVTWRRFISWISYFRKCSMSGQYELGDKIRLYQAQSLYSPPHHTTSHTNTVCVS